MRAVRRKPCQVHALLDVSSSRGLLMFEDALVLGGTVRLEVDTETGEVLAGGGSPLSMFHISPKITYRRGASVLKVERGRKAKEEAGKEEKRGKVKRGNAGAFSVASRRRYMYFLNSVRRDCKPHFVTLTYPDLYPENSSEFKRDLDNFIKRLKREFPKAGGSWKLEPQERGAPHYHLLVWGVELQELREFVPQAWYEVVGSGDWFHLAWHEGQLHDNIHCVQPAESFDTVNAYVLKYMSKEVGTRFEGWGRWWGVFAKENIPFGEEVAQVITEKQAIQAIRYIRNYLQKKSKERQKLAKLQGRKIPKMPSRDYRSLSFVTRNSAEYWLERLTL